MTMTIATATARISRQLPEAEGSLDSALLASTRLMESMLMARQGEGLALHTGQEAIMRLARAQRALIESQNAMIGVHRHLLSAGREIRAITDEPENCEPSARVDAAKPLLRSA